MEQLTSALQQFGWSKYEANCYAALVRYGSMKASRIATETGINQSKIYQPLQSLEEQGYVRIIDENPKIYAAQNPQYVVEEERETFHKNSQDILGNLQEAWEIGEELRGTDESAWVSRGRQGKRQEAKKAIEAAENEVLIYDNRLIQTPRSVIEKLEEALNRDVEVGVIGPAQASSKLERLKRLGARVKTHTDLERTSFYIVDNSMAVFTLSDGENSIVIHDEDATRILTREYEALRQEASEVPEQ